MIAHLPSATNVTLECSIFDENTGMQLSTFWSIQRTDSAEPPIEARQFLTFFTEVIYEGDFRLREEYEPFIMPPTYQNHIIIRNYVQILNGHTLLCGAGLNLTLAGFPLRVYSKNYTHIISHHFFIRLL